MNPSIYAIVSTFISFIVIMVFYIIAKPDFVMEIDKNSNDQKPKLSVRLSIVYGLMFSSMIGLVVLGISSIMKNYKGQLDTETDTESETDTDSYISDY